MFVDVAGAPGVDRQRRPARIPSRAVDDPILVDRHRNRQLDRRPSPPARLAGAWVIRVDPPAGVDDQLVPVVGRHDDRRAVGAEQRATVHDPPFLAGGGVECQHIRVGRMVALQDQQVLIQLGRAAVTPEHIERRVVLADMTRPELAALEIEGDQLTGAEPGEESGAVGHHAGCREVVVAMHSRDRPCGRQPMLPREMPVPATKRLHEQGDALVLTATAGPSGAGELRATFVDRSGAKLGRQEDEVAPDDRCRRAEPLERNPPRDVVVWAPVGGDVRLGGDAETARSAPLRPVLGGGRRRGRQQCDEGRDERPKPEVRSLKPREQHRMSSIAEAPGRLDTGCRCGSDLAVLRLTPPGRRSPQHR